MMNATEKYFFNHHLFNFLVCEINDKLSSCIIYWGKKVESPILRALHDHPKPCEEEVIMVTERSLIALLIYCYLMKLASSADVEWEILNHLIINKY